MRVCSNVGGVRVYAHIYIYTYMYVQAGEKTARTLVSALVSTRRLLRLPILCAVLLFSCLTYF